MSNFELELIHKQIQKEKESRMESSSVEPQLNFPFDIEDDYEAPPLQGDGNDHQVSIDDDEDDYEAPPLQGDGNDNKDSIDDDEDDYEAPPLQGDGNDNKNRLTTMRMTTKRRRSRA